MADLELRCERGLSRAFAWAGSSRAAGNRRPKRLTDKQANGIALTWFLAVFAIVVAALVISLTAGVGVALLIALIAVVLGAVLMFGYLLGSLWWATGAGGPMLLIRDGMVRGRIRPVAKRAAPDATAPDWWDFAVPITELHGAKIVRVGTDRAGSGSASVVLEMPAALSNELLNNEPTARVGSMWMGYGGSAVGWPVGRMLRRRGRAERVRALLAALDPTKQVS